MTAMLIVVVGLACWIHGRLSGAARQREFMTQLDETEHAIAGRSPGKPEATNG